MSEPFLESLMIGLFMISWPIDIYYGLKTKSAEGKSIIFLYIINFGYVIGLFNKIFYTFDYAIVMYILNLVLGVIDIWITRRNMKYDEERAMS